MKTKKDFDSVKMMRDIRNKHREEYEKNPELREKRLAEIRKKYFFRIKNNELASSKKER
jgi:hypothetical protein